MSKTFEVTEKLRELIQSEVQDLMAQNVDAITTELYDNPEGKLNVSISVKLKAVKDRIHSTATLAYSRKFTDEVEDSVIVEDPAQPKLEFEKPEVKSDETDA
jgi:hypothetical protein